MAASSLVFERSHCCDQLLGHSENKAAVNKRAFEEVIENTRVHLQMVFHRFLGRPRKPIAITVNDYPCDAWDPFLKDHDKTQLIAEDPLLCAGEMISDMGAGLSSLNIIAGELDR